MNNDSDSDSDSDSDKSDDESSSEDEQQLLERLQDALRRERTSFAERYKVDKGFRKAVEEYTRVRLGYFKQLDNEKLDEAQFKEIFDTAKEDLALRLLRIYGHFADDGSATADFNEKCREAGHAYAYASWWINNLNAAPGILRSMALLGTQVAREFYAVDDATRVTLGYVESAVYLGYAAVQFAVTIYAPYRQAAMQDVDVSRQVAKGPAHIPAVSPDQIMVKYGQPEPIRKKKEILQALNTIDRDATILWGLDDLYKHDDEFAIFIDTKTKANKTRHQLLWELNWTALYTQMDVNEGQSRNRAYRAMWNLTAASTSLASGIASLAGAVSWVPTMVSGIGLVPLVGQPFDYARRHGDLAGQDYGRKIVSLFEIAAMTGLGDLLDEKTMKIVPHRLDEMVKTAMALRIDYARKVLEFDADIHLCAVIGHLLEHPGAPNKGVEFIETRAAFLKLSQKAQTTRIDQLKPETRNSAASKLLKIYYGLTNCMSELKKGNLVSALDDPSAIGDEFRRILIGGLKSAADPTNATEQDLRDDETLMQKKGDALRLSDLPSSHQAAQKWGQSGSYVVLGSAGFNIIKMTYSIIKGITEAFDPKLANAGLKTVTTSLATAQGALQIISSYFAWQLGYSQHKNINLKNVFRGRDADKKSIPHQGTLDANYLPQSHGVINNFTTLLVPQIDPTHLPGEIAFEVQTTTVSDIWKQTNIASLRKAAKGIYLSAVGGNVSPKPDPDMQKVLEQGVTVLEDFYKEFTQREIEPKINEVMALWAQVKTKKDAEEEIATLLAQMGHTHRKRLQPRRQPWSEIEMDQLYESIDRLDGELNEQFRILEESTYHKQCLTFTEYAQCRANEINVRRRAAFLDEVKQMDLPAPSKWREAFRDLRTRHSDKKTTAKKSNARKLSDVLKDYATQNGLEQTVISKVKTQLESQDDLKISLDHEVTDINLRHLNKLVAEERLAYEKRCIENLRQDDKPNHTLDLLATISRYFAYPEKESFENFAKSFCKKSSNTITSDKEQVEKIRQIQRRATVATPYREPRVPQLSPKIQDKSTTSSENPSGGSSPNLWTSGNLDKLRPEQINLLDLSDKQLERLDEQALYYERPGSHPIQGNYSTLLIYHLGPTKAYKILTDPINTKRFDTSKWLNAHGFELITKTIEVAKASKTNAIKESEFKACILSFTAGAHDRLGEEWVVLQTKNYDIDTRGFFAVQIETGGDIKLNSNDMHSAVLDFLSGKKITKATLQFISSTI